MNNNPLFSVLIANYNNSNFLVECINSVKNQTYSNWEIIIVDDHSTDNPTLIYNELSNDPRIKIYSNDSNRKTAYTFKRALDNSNGEICGFLGPDDTLVKTALEETIAKHLQLSDYSIVYTLSYLCDEDLNVIELFRWGGVLPVDESQLTVPSGKKICSFATFKRSFYSKTEGINTKFTRGFDQDFYYKMEEVGKVYCIEKPLYLYRQHNRNISLNENNIKAWYWLYIANKDAYYRRKNTKSSINNTSYGDLQRTYIKVCLLKIDEKIRCKRFKNILFFYYQIIIRIIWDKHLLILQAHILFFKRVLLKKLKKHEGSPLQYN